MNVSGKAPCPQLRWATAIGLRLMPPSSGCSAATGVPQSSWSPIFDVCYLRSDD